MTTFLYQISCQAVHEHILTIYVNVKPFHSYFGQDNTEIKVIKNFEERLNKTDWTASEPTAMEL